jgi:hypothetical protein
VTAYPVYFTGDIREPKDKLIFIENPGFNEKENRKEQAFLRNRGSYEGYCRIFADFFGQGGKAGLYTVLWQYRHLPGAIFQN